MTAIALITCYILAIVALAASVAYARKNGKRGSRAAYLLIGLLAADFFLTLPLAWGEAAGQIWFLPLDFYNVLCMMFYEGIADTFYISLLTTCETQSAMAYWAPFMHLYIFTILLCCTATPVCAATSAYALLTRQLSNFVVGSKVRNHARRSKGTLFVFGGLDDRSIMVARSIFEEQRQSMLSAGMKHPLCVFTGVTKENRESRSSVIEEFGDKPVYFYERSAQDLLREVGSSAIRKAHDMHVLFLGNDIEDESENLGDAVSFLEFLSPKIPENERQGNDGFPRFHIYCACHGESDELALDSIDGTSGFDIKVIDECRETMYKLLWEHPLFESLRDDPCELVSRAVESSSRKSDLNIVIIGCGRYGFEALRACFWNGQIPSVNLRFHVIDKMSWQRFSSMMKHRCPGFFQGKRFPVAESPADASRGIPGKLTVGEMFSISYHEADVDGLAFDNAIENIRSLVLDQVEGRDVFQISPIAPYCIITLGNDDLNTDAAIRLRRLFAGNGEQPAIIPRVHVDIHDTRRHDVVSKLRVRGGAGSSNKAWQYTLQPFGGTASIFNVAHLLDSKLEALALNVNASYSGAFESEAKATSAEIWNNFLGYSAWQMNKLSSISCALGLKTKLWLLGFQIVDGAQDRDESAMTALKDALAQLCDKHPRNLGELHRHPQLEVLSRMEHDRWEAVYCGDGWVGMSGKTSNTFRDSGLSGGRHDCHLFLRHPYICPFDQLEEVADQVGKPSPVEYDVVMISNMAKMIANARSFARRSFGIRSVD